MGISKLIGIHKLAANFKSRKKVNYIVFEMDKLFQKLIHFDEQNRLELRARKWVFNVSWY